ATAAADHRQSARRAAEDSAPGVISLRAENRRELVQQTETVRSKRRAVRGRNLPRLRGEVGERSEPGGGTRQDRAKHSPSPALPGKREREQTETAALPVELIAGVLISPAPRRGRPTPRSGRTGSRAPPRCGCRPCSG